MDKHPKIIKRQRASLTESIFDSTPTSESSFVEADEPTLSAEPEQFFESVERHSPVDSWSATDTKPLSDYPAWQEELREIRQESDLDVWDSCPYD